MFTLTLILLFAKFLFVAATDNATDNQDFVASTNEPPSTIDLILAELKENKQQLQNLEKNNKDFLENLERKTRRHLQDAERANRQQLQLLEQANRQQLQILEQAKKEQFQNLEKQMKDIECAPRENSQFKNLFPKNCQQLLESGITVGGFYIINPETSPKPFVVRCDFFSHGKGWTVVLDKVNASLDFDLSWDDYKYGFGNVANHYWLGLENLYHLTGFETNELLIKVEDRVNYDRTIAHYKFFSIGSESQGYRLKLVGGYSGDTGDYLSDLEGIKFSTKDRDEDSDTPWDCASDGGGGWWYSNCSKFYFERILQKIGHPLWHVEVMVRPKKD